VPYTLFEEVSSYENLQSAWGRVRHSGLLSLSEKTRESIKAFDSVREAKLSEIMHQLQEGTFSFGTVRGAPVARPGKDPRPLVVPEIPARIVQRSILDTLQRQDSISAFVNRPRSFGGLPKKSRADAIRCACEAVAAGATYYVNSDIRGFFTQILRQEVLQTVHQLLPDDSLTTLLDEATSIEISNVSEIEDYIHLFPEYDEGVAQGCCLSPLFGNIYMHNFDEIMNSQDVFTIRYIDDFLILGPDRRTTEAAFGRARRLLARLNLGAYLPADGSGKASEGSVKRGFDFLGCTVTPNVVQPSRSARSHLLERIKGKLNVAARQLFRGSGGLAGQYEASLVETLSLISRMIHAWTEQYKFCNPTNAFYSVDAKVDRLIGHYLKTFFKRYRKSRSTPEERRRMLGVWLAIDGSRDPILTCAKPQKHESLNKASLHG